MRIGRKLELELFHKITCKGEGAGFIYLVRLEDLFQVTEFEMKRCILFLASILIALQVEAAQQAEFCKMEPAIRELEEDPKRERDLLRDYLRDKQIVFVSGYLGCSGREFRDTRTVIRYLDRKVPLSLLCPPSGRSIEDNVRYLLRRFRALANRYPDRKMILIGHSKGGTEILQTLATYPELFEMDETRGYQVESAVTISAPFGGSLLADLLLDINPELTERWERFAEENGILDNAFTRWITKLFLDPSSDGFRSLTTSSAYERNLRLMEGMDETTREILRRKVFYVTAQRNGAVSEEDLPFFIRPIAKFLSEFESENDGLVMERDQRLSEFGTSLLQVNGASHFSLIDQFGEPHCRREFTRLLFLNLALNAQAN